MKFDNILNEQKSSSDNNQQQSNNNSQFVIDEYSEKNLLITKQTEQNQQQQYKSPRDGWYMLINLLLAGGPFTLPHAFNEAGLILGSIFLFFFMTCAYLSSEYLIETLSIINALHNEDISDISNISCDQFQFSVNGDNESDESIKSYKKPYFSLVKQYEYGKIGEILWGKIGKYPTNICIVTYLIGVLSIKVVSASESLNFGAQFIITNSVGGLENSLIVDPYYISLFLFFTPCVYLSLKDISKITKLQKYIVIMRFFVLSLMIIGGFIYIYDKKMNYQDFNQFNMNQQSFIAIFGNTVLAFLAHHSLTQVFRSVRPETEIKNTIFKGFLSASLILLIICVTAVLAFGDLTNHCYESFPCEIGVLYNENFLDLPFFGHIINFYLLLNIAPFPIMARTLKNAIMNLINEGYSEQQVDKQSDAMQTFLSLIPVLMISLFFKDELSGLLEITGGITGVCIMIIIPSLMVLSARQKSFYTFGKYSLRNIHQSTLKSNIWAYLMISFGSSLLVFTIYIKLLIDG